MKEKKLVVLLLMIILSTLFILISGCTEAESEVNNSAQILDTDEQWKEDKQLDTNNGNEVTDEQEVSEDTGIEPITVVFSENDSGSTVNAIIGDTLIVLLEENPTTGYSWNLSTSPGLLLMDQYYEEGTEGEDVVGAGGTHRWIFEVTEDNEQNISAVYKRPWEEITGNESKFDLIVNVIPEEKLIKANGTVNYIELEGGFYGITDQNGTHYEPVNLDEDLKKDGLEIEFIAYPMDDMVSINMWGRIIEIRSATVVE
ncbi:protease inhibitor I42 family protein [Methanolobus sp. ZRKC2]|uniref:protease inhibitor I42 family protein n=1 Tax=Methanolobus sp. ZRKC2 TaxID=3125783 RepID=UPI0032441CFA